MAKIGLSKPYFAKYSASGTTVTYSDGGLIGKYTEMSIEVESSDANILYADNAAAESDKSFAGGTFNITTDNLDATTMKTILGLATEAIGVGGTDSWQVFDDTQAIPYLGVGGIIKKKVNGVDKYVAFILDKVQFDIPSIAAVTQGESIDWQTQELSATIMRSDASNHPWYRISTEFADEDDAANAIETFLSIT